MGAAVKERLDCPGNKKAPGGACLLGLPVLLDHPECRVGGGTGIRTLERLSPLPVFKTGAFNRSAIPPAYGAEYYQFSVSGQEPLAYQDVSQGELALAHCWQSLARSLAKCPMPPSRHAPRRRYPAPC